MAHVVGPAIGGLLDGGLHQVSAGADHELPQLPGAAQSDLVGADLVQGALVGLAGVGALATEALGDAL